MYHEQNVVQKNFVAKGSESSLYCCFCAYCCFSDYRLRHSRRRGYGDRVCMLVCLFVCLFVCSNRKRLKLSTPYLVHVYSVTVARHAVTQRSKGQSLRSFVHSFVLYSGPQRWDLLNLSHAPAQGDEGSW